MRRTIWGKDDYFEVRKGTGNNDRDYVRINLDSFGVELSDGVPLVANFDLQNPPIGTVNEIEFSEGVISGVPVFFEGNEHYDSLLVSGEMVLGGYYTHLKRSADRETVLHANLAAVSMVIRDQIPMRTEEV